MWSRLGQALLSGLNLFLPPACLLCGKLLPSTSDQQYICISCQGTMPSLGDAHCILCCRPFPKATSTHLCGPCLKRPPHFSKVHAACAYQDGTKEAIHRLKYRNQVTLAKPLGEILGQAVSIAENDLLPDCIVPVPLHPSRLKDRGYNQALEIARPLAHKFQIPIDNKLLQRSRKTAQQQGLSAIERRNNLRNAFTLTASASTRKILLIDDVMTTGETVRECCRILNLGGAKDVQVAVVGRV